MGSKVNKYLGMRQAFNHSDSKEVSHSPLGIVFFFVNKLEKNCFDLILRSECFMPILCFRSSERTNKTKRSSGCLKGFEPE